MAKGNMLLGQARGKVGSLVFSRLNGQQITRAKAEKVSNPRTDSQNLQRAIFATVAKATQALGAIVDHSFQSVKYGSDSLNYFRKHNLDILRSAYFAGKGVDLLTKGADSVVANEYLVAQGSLPSVNVVQADFSGASNQGIDFYIPNINSVPGSNGNSPYVTLGQLNSRFGIQAGDQITVVGIANVLDYDDTPEGSGRVVYARAVLLPDLDANSPVINNAGFVADAIDPNASTNKEFLKLVSVGDGSLRNVVVSPTLGGLITADAEVADAVAIIVSRYDNLSSKWLRSSARMTLSAQSVALHNTDGDQSAIDSYGNSETVASSTEYLNQGESNRSSSEVQDISRGNYVITVESPTDGVVAQVKDLQSGVIDLQSSVRLTSSMIIKVKATTFKGVTIEDFLAEDVDGTGLDIRGTISTAGKQGKVQIPLSSINADAQQYQVILLCTTLFENSNIHSSKVTLNVLNP